MQATEWSFLPEEGGLLGQDDELFDDLVTAQWRYQKLKDMVEASGVSGGIIRDFRKYASDGPEPSGPGGLNN